MAGQENAGKSVSAGYAHYFQGTVPTTASDVAVAFDLRGDRTVSVLDAGRYISVIVTAKPALVDAEVTLQFRAHPGAEWVDFAAAATMAAGTTATVVEGLIRGSQIQVLVKSTGADDAVDIAVCLK